MQGPRLKGTMHLYPQSDQYTGAWQVLHIIKYVEREEKGSVQQIYYRSQYGKAGHSSVSSLLK